MKKVPSPLRQQLLDQQGRRFRSRVIEVDGLSILVRSTNVSQAAAINRFVEAKDTLGAMVQILVAACLDPETKEPIFTEEDIGILQELPADSPLLVEVTKAFGELQEEARNLDTKST